MSYVNPSYVSRLLDDLMPMGEDKYDVEEIPLGVSIRLDADTNVGQIVALTNALGDYEVEREEEPGVTDGEEYRLNVYDGTVGDVLLRTEPRDKLEVRFDHKARPRTVRKEGQEEVVGTPGRDDEKEYYKVSLTINGAAGYDAFVPKNTSKGDRTIIETWLDGVEHKHMDDPALETREVEVYEREGFMVHAREVEV